MVDSYCFLLFQKARIFTLYHVLNTQNFHILIISDNQSFISQILKVVGPLGGKVRFFFSFSWDLKFETLLITKPQKLSFTQAELSHLTQTLIICIPGDGLSCWTELKV